jgi:hypothetical protein
MPAPAKHCQGNPLRARSLLIAIATTCAVVLTFTAPASATTVHPHEYSGNYFESGTSGSEQDFTRRIVVNPSNGRVLTNVRLNELAQYNALGTPIPFSDPALNGATSFPFYGNGIGSSEVDFAIDGTNGSTAGNIYVNVEGVGVYGFTAGGAPLTGTNFPLTGFTVSCGVAVDPNGNVWVADYRAKELVEFTPAGAPIGRISTSPVQPCQPVIDGDGNFYTIERPGNVVSSGGPVRKYDSEGNFQYMLDSGQASQLAIDYSNNDIYVGHGPGYVNDVTQYNSQGQVVDKFGGPEPANSYPGLEGFDGIGVNSTTHDVYVSNRRDYAGKTHVDIFKAGPAKIIPTVVAQDPDPVVDGATLHGTVDADGGGDTTECYFEWGFNPYGDLGQYYDQVAPCSPAGPFTGSGTHAVSATLTGLTQGRTYHYRLVATNANGIPARSGDISFQPQGPATIVDESLSDVNTDSVRFNFEADPNGGDTGYHVEVGPAPCSANPCSAVPAKDEFLLKPLGVQGGSVVLNGLTPDTVYYARLVVTNALGAVTGPDYEFRTYPTDVSGIDSCPNSFFRQETRSTDLLECRAYELVSARDAGGYDVQSDLVPGQVPLVAYPRASDQLLYSLHHGTIPGIAGSPTNFGLDAYVATRDPEQGWTTRYVGLPSDGTPSAHAFGSVFDSASDDMSTFAFGGPGFCAPCFADGTTGIPVRLPTGALVQGMAGSLDPGPVEQDGYVGRRFSADGTHLIFGSAGQFEPDGNANGDVSIYDRNLDTGITQVISKTPGGANLACLGGIGTCHSPGDPHGIASLDVSADGSRVIVAQRVSTDSNGNDHWHPYMHVGASPNTIDLAPGTTSGVLYGGMSEDGTKVYFTTKDQLLPDDTDTSADLYRADVTSSGATLTRVSTGLGGAGNTDACDPVPAAGENWNEVGSSSPENCSVTVIAGGGGVAAEEGSIYFLSPEKLDGGSNGVLDQPNLYLARPGSPPRFVATLEPDNGAVLSGTAGTSKHSYGNFQVTPDGNFAAFSSNLPLTGFPVHGNPEIYRYDARSDSIACASCPPTGATATVPATLSRFGLNLTDRGLIFFTTAEALVLRDTNGKKDAYEWANGKIQLVSTGASLEDAGLVTASADGRDAFFYTHEVLAPQDANGSAMKIYTARVNGGFPHTSPPLPCQASDECHGPGSEAAPPPDIGTFKGTGGQFIGHLRKAGKCKRPRARRHGRCVKPQHPKRKRGRRHG